MHENQWWMNEQHIYTWSGNLHFNARKRNLNEKNYFERNKESNLKQNWIQRNYSNIIIVETLKQRIIGKRKSPIERISHNRT